MSRSLHTRPAQILAASRVRDPYASRRAGDTKAPRALSRQAQERGLSLEYGIPPGLNALAPLPRLYAQRPQPGFMHPASVADIERMLRCSGEKCTYGLRSVELVQARSAEASTALVFGKLLVPGRILLFAQRPSPWHLPGGLSLSMQRTLARAGACVTPVGCHTHVSWPGHTLRDFMLFEVLMHEVGHHMIQQYKGKRPARVVRTRDHEAFAEHFAAQCRRRFENSAFPSHDQ